MPIFNPEIECASRDYLRAIQSARLIKMVKNAYENVPFYKAKFDEIGLKPEDIRSIDDITKLPFTVKTDLRDNYPFGLFAVPKGDLVRIHASSGTTGKPTVVGYTQHDIDVWAEGAARAISAAGGTKDDTVHIAYGYGLFTGGLGIHYGAEKLGATALPASTGNTSRQIQMLQDFESNIICCTPSYAMFIGETIREMGIDPKTLPVRAGIFGAEPWTEEMRRGIEEVLGIKAYDIYGLTETSGPGVAFECCEQTGMHINEDHFYAEIIDPETGEVLPEGSKGELVFTSLDKEAFPLLRYRTRDICVLSREKCSCGRTLVKMAKPMGRTDDMLIIRGVNVFPSQIETVLLNEGYQPNYQIVVDRVKNNDTFDINVEMNPEQFTDKVSEILAMEKSLANAMKTMLGINPSVHLVPPKSITRSEGKAVRVIDKRKLV
ncbi:MAG: phenylacetate--CoA ligase [Clostridia bacterium]|nr:phenylacetate--CoA ligase [Clostridia bacterium]